MATASWQEGETGLPGVAVSDQVQVVITDASGRFEMDARGYGLVFMSQPDGYVVNGPYWRAADGAPVEFGLTTVSRVSSFTFVHASDTHISEASVPRVRRLREMVDSLQPDFVLITGDLVRDALRVSEDVARGYYDLLERELAQFTVPVYTGIVPGSLIAELDQLIDEGMGADIDVKINVLRQGEVGALPSEFRGKKPEEVPPAINE